MKKEDVIIIGAGPAGVGCAIQLMRNKIKPLLFERERIGGLLVNANLVENYPGFPGGIPGPQLCRLMEEQFYSEGLTFKKEIVEEVSFGNDMFDIRTDSGNYFCSILVIASGTKPVIPHEVVIGNDNSKKILFEAYPLFNTDNLQIAIIGGGDLAFDYAASLGIKNKVTMFVRSDKIKANLVLQEKIKALENITCYTGVIIQQSECKDEKIILTIQRDNHPSTFRFDYIIFAIGRFQNLDFINDNFRKKIPLLEKEGLLYFIGDVCNQHYRQSSIAAGDGVKAAMKIEEKLIQIC